MNGAVWCGIFAFCERPRPQGASLGLSGVTGTNPAYLFMDETEGRSHGKWKLWKCHCRTGQFFHTGPGAIIAGPLVAGWIHVPVNGTALADPAGLGHPPVVHNRCRTVRATGTGIPAL